MINQNALENVLVDIQFLKDQFMVVGLEKFTGAFDELVMVSYFFHFTVLRLPHSDPRLYSRRWAYRWMTKSLSIKTNGRRNLLW